MDNYTKRCIYAILQLEAEYVQWPDATERCNIKHRIGQDSFFKSCVGFIDGTLINFAAAPIHHKEDYWTRKSVYALNSLLICDDQRKVIYAHHGWCGSAHDQRVLKSTTVRPRFDEAHLDMVLTHHESFSSFEPCQPCSPMASTSSPTPVTHPWNI